MSPNVGPCRSCGTPVLWREHVTSGRVGPLDAEPNPAGNAILLDDGKYRILSFAEREGEDDVPGPRYMPHFATCPQGKAWRGKGAA